MLNIAIVGSVRDEQYFGINTTYFEFFSKLSTNIYVIPPTQDDLSKIFDLLVLTGGADILSTKYKELPHITSEKSDPFLEYHDDYTLTNFINSGKPIIGICRGFQAINIKFGGTLTQDLSYHERSVSPYDLVNTIILNSGKTIKTNSFHHQGIKSLGSNLKVIGKNKTDNLPEIIKHDNLPIIGFQFHPEMCIGWEFSDFALSLIKQLI